MTAGAASAILSVLENHGGEMPVLPDDPPPIPRETMLDIRRAAIALVQALSRACDVPGVTVDPKAEKPGFRRK